MNIRWRNRFDALAPSALIAFDAAARRLKEKLSALDDEKLSELQGVFAENLIFLSGGEESLPWVDGVIYLGKDALAPAIFLPTNLRPDIPVDLFEKVLLRKFSDRKPFAVVENSIVEVGKMLPVSGNVLSKIQI